MEPRGDFWAGRQVCVTGGTGFLGFHLVRQLLALGARVRTLSLPVARPRPRPTLAEVEALSGDIRDADTVRRAVKDCSVIFHTAGLVAVWGPALKRLEDVHVTGTRNVLTAAPEGARVVHTSSMVTLGATRTGEARTEDDAFNQHRLRVDYVHAKRAAEDIALAAAAAGRHVMVTNPGYLIGPEDYERSVMGRFCLRFWRGRMLLAPSGGLNLADVRDVARGHLLAAEHGRPGRRYVLGGENYPMPALLNLLARVAGLRPPTLPRLPQAAVRCLARLAEGWSLVTGKEPYPSAQQARLSELDWFCRSDRARAELGYAVRPVEESLTDAFRWYLAQKKVCVRGLNAWWMRPARKDGRAA
jgi:dihydroflavonol-4-reductase